jgi:choice-of-anchor B domain-containing protein
MVHLKEMFIKSYFFSTLVILLKLILNSIMKKIAFILFLFTQIVLAQTPCIDGFAGEYPCNDYDLMSNIPVDVLANTTGTPEGSDLWGWTDSTTGKEYALAAMTNSTAFVDVTDPINPIFLGRLDSNDRNNFWRDVKIYKDHAFIVGDNVGAHGMQVFDLTKLRGVTTPQDFTADAIYNEDNLGSCHNIVINEDSGIAYLVGCKTAPNNFGSTSRLFNGGPIFVDLSDPKNPLKMNAYADAGYSHDAQVITYNGPDPRYSGKEIYVGSNEDRVTILDVTEKDNVVKLAEITYSQTGYTHQGWFTDDHRYFILGDELDEQRFGGNTRTLVFDFNDLENPVLSSTYFGPTLAIDHNGYVKGNEYHMASYRAGLRVLDITNISATTNSMTEIGSFDTYPGDNAASFNGAWSVYPYFESGNILINDIERGLFVVRKSGSPLNINTETARTNFSIYPNPAKSQTTITIGNNKTIESIQVYSILGQKVIDKKNLKRPNYVLNTANLNKGIYLIKINGKRTKKFIVE